MINFNSQTKRNFQKKATLDCETCDSARLSVANIMGLPPEELIAFLRDFDLERYIEKNPEYTVEDHGFILLKELLSRRDCTWGFSHTTWFHMTRCSSKEIFKDGLLPLPVVIEQIWKLLFEINSSGIQRSEWDEFRDSIKSRNLTYRIRMSKSSQQGPDGFLIGDLDFNDILGHAHLWESPEVIRLICQQFGHNLLEDYIKNTNVCIVKFETYSSESHNLATALNYIYELEQPVPEFTHYQTNCHIGNGCPVLPVQIKKITII